VHPGHGRGRRRLALQDVELGLSRVVDLLVVGPVLGRLRGPGQASVEVVGAEQVGRGQAGVAGEPAALAGAAACVLRS